MNNLKRKSIEEQTSEIIDLNSKTKVIGKETAYHCNICDKYYASYKSYGNHTRSYHGKNKEKSKCPYCGNCFTRRDNLQQHIKLFHSSIDRQFVCTFCGELFTNKSNCLKHKEKCVNIMKDRDANIQSYITNGLHGQHMYKTAPPDEQKYGSQVNEKPVQPLSNNFSKNNTQQRNDSPIMANGYPSNYKHKVDDDTYCECEDCDIYKSRRVLSGNKDALNTTEHNHNAPRQYVNEFVHNDYVKRNELYSERSVLKYTHQKHFIENKDKLTPIPIKDKPTVENGNGCYEQGRLLNGSYVAKKEQPYPMVYSEENRYLKEEISDNYYDGNNGTEDANNNASEALDCTICNITFLTRQDYEDHKPYCDSSGGDTIQ